MRQFFARAQHFSDRVREFLESRVNNGELANFSCTFQPSFGLSSTLIAGKRRSKAPAQESSEAELTLQAKLAGGESFTLEYNGLSYPDFLMAFESALKIARPLKHDSTLQRHAAYPEVELTSQDLLEVLQESGGIQHLDEVATHLDREAAKVNNPRLMSREINTNVEASVRQYFDSLGNQVEEFSTHCDAAVAFSLTDTNEYQHDAFGRLPSRQELNQLVEEAARSVMQIEVKEYQSEPETAVLLTPRAFSSLINDLLLPNVSARTLLDGSGAWNLDKLFRMVLPGVTIRDNPLLPMSPFSQCFDMEGTPSKPVVIMDKGKLVHPLLTSSLLAELLAANPENRDSFGLTGHAASPTSTDQTNLFVEIEGEVFASADALRDLVKNVVTINNLTGSTYDPITGQFAMDAEGAKVFRNGKLLYSTNLTLRGNFLEALADSSRRIGPTERVFDTHVPWFLTPKLTCVAKKLASEEN